MGAKRKTRYQQIEQLCAEALRTPKGEMRFWALGSPTFRLSGLLKALRAIRRLAAHPTEGKDG